MMALFRVNSGTRGHITGIEFAPESSASEDHGATGLCDRVFWLKKLTEQRHS
jgi:hypothetical protein